MTAVALNIFFREIKILFKTILWISHFFFFEKIAIVCKQIKNKFTYFEKVKHIGREMTSVALSGDPLRTAMAATLTSASADQDFCQMNPVPSGYPASVILNFSYFRIVNIQPMLQRFSKKF